MRRLPVLATVLLAPVLVLGGLAPATADGGHSTGGRPARHCPADWTVLDEAELTARTGEDVGRLELWAKPGAAGTWCGEVRLHRAFRDLRGQYELYAELSTSTAGAVGPVDGRSTAVPLRVRNAGDSAAKVRFTVHVRDDDGLRATGKVRATTP